MTPPVSPSLENHSCWQLAYLCINPCIHSNWHSHQSLSFNTRGETSLSHKLCVKEWLPIKGKKNEFPQGLFLYQGRSIPVWDYATCFHSSRWQKGLSAMWNLLRTKALLIEIKKAAQIYLVARWFVIHSC